jgi:hypothetical protein
LALLLVKANKTMNRAGSWEQRQKIRQQELKRFGKSRTTHKWLYSLILTVGVGLPLIALGVYFYQNYEPTTELEVADNTITVRRGGDFQAALNRAKAGDTIVLEAGAIFKGNFILPNKPGNQFITIRTSASDSQLPNGDNRLEPTKHAQFLPKILTVNSDPAIRAEKGARNYRFIGVEISADTDKYVYNLVSLGTDEKRFEDLPQNIEFDRVYVHPSPKGKTRRGIALNGGAAIVKNSHLSGFAYREEETQAIAGWSGPGPFKIINNYLEAGAENIMFGGSDPTIKGVIPSDIEIRNNLMTKPPDWRGNVSIKCTLELKNARRVNISGNIIEHTFDDLAVRLTVRNQDGTAPWSSIEDVVLENNVIRNSGGGILFLGTDDNHQSQIMKRVKVVNNLFLNLDAAKYGADGRFILISGGEDITVANNTVFHSGNMLTAHGNPVKNFVFRDNILSHNNYGYNGDNVGVGKAVLPKYFPNGFFSGNVIVNGKNIPQSDVYVPARNYFAPNFQAVGFVDLNANNFRLSPNSNFKGKGWNGKDPGVDFTVFEKQFTEKY